MKCNNLSTGDYVLATKYKDGDPQDHWYVGFLDLVSIRGDGIRYYVKDNNGKLFRRNGFRWVKRINPNEGRWPLEHKEEIEMSGLSLWEWLTLLRQTEPSFWSGRESKMKSLILFDGYSQDYGGSKQNEKI